MFKFKMIYEFPLDVFGNIFDELMVKQSLPRKTNYRERGRKRDREKR